MEMSSDRKKQLVNLCRKMIQTPSVTGSEERLVNLLKQEMLDLGYDEVKIDKLGNIIGKIQGTGNGKSILFDGHLDTVAITNRSSWTREPFGAEIENARIYGRGAADMKGALAAMIMAGADVKKDRKVANADIYVSGTVFEEVAEGYALDSVLVEAKPDIVVIGEASQLRLNIGQRGRAEIVVRTKGRPVHSSNPEIGINAVQKMMLLLEMIMKLENKYCSMLGSGNLVLTDIISSPYPGASVIPEYCTATFDRRLLTGETEESILVPIRECIEELSARDPDFSAEAYIAETDIETYRHHKGRHRKIVPAWLMDRDHDVVAHAMRALKGPSDKDIEVGSYSFCTNGSCSAGVKGIPTIGFGPGREDQAHVNDEYIEIGELTGAYQGYYALMSTSFQGKN